MESTRPFIHLAAAGDKPVVEIIFPKGTSAQDATKAAGRAVSALTGFVVEPVEASVSVGEMWTAIRLFPVVQSPLVDAREVLKRIGDAIGN